MSRTSVRIEKTGKVINDKYTIGKMIGRDGVHEVFTGTQRIADGIERKVALKLLHDWKSIEERERAHRISEIATIAEIGAHPFITSVCDCGIDPDLGPWLAMEIASGALDQRIGPEPANPALVRVVMDQMLQALMFVHEREKPIIHNNIKPRSILQLTSSTWVLGNFNLAADFGSDKTLSEVTVKYASPEVLDVDQGEVGAASDLYSLGFCLYELALGSKRFEACFPSVYGSGGGSAARGSSENDKWIYWHVSPQLTLPPLKEQLPNFPEDLSDAIAWMLRKPLQERASSARILSESIARGNAAAVAWEPPQETEKKEPNPALTKALLAVVCVALVLGVAFVGFRSLFGGPVKPDLKLEKAFESSERFVQISGTVGEIAPGTSLILTAGKDLLRSRAVAKIDSDTGAFSAQLELPVLGEYEGLCGVVDPAGNVTATTLFSITRKPPETVRVSFATRPPAFSARLAVRQLVSGDEVGELVPAARLEGVTDEKGVCTLAIPYGPYDLVLEHPRFQQYKRRLETELNKEKPVELLLVYLPPEEVKARQQALQNEYESLKARAAAGDPEAIRRMAEIQKELAQLNDADPARVDASTQAAVLAKKKAIQEERMTLLKEAEELRKRAAAGDPEAIKRLQEINQRLEQLNREEAKLKDGGSDASGGNRPSNEELDALAAQRADLVRRAAAGDPEAKAALEKLDRELRQKGIDPENIQASKKQQTAAEKRAAIEKRMAELAARAAAGDPEAVAEMQKLKQQLAAVEEQEKAEARAKARQEVVEQMQALAARAAAGDPEAIAKMRELQKKLVMLDAGGDVGADPESRQALIKRIQELKERAAKGDPEAIRELKELERKSEILKALSEGRITPEQADALLRNAQKLSTLDRVTLLAMDLATLRQYLLDDLPRGAITVTEDAVLNKLHVRGVVLDREELVRVMMRLAPAEQRLLMDVQVDPEGLVDRLQAALVQHSIAGSTVHPFVIGPRHSLFVGMPAGSPASLVEAARLIVADFTAVPDRVTVKVVPARRQEAPAHE